MSGLELQEELLKRTVDWPFILMSGQGDIPTAVRTVKLGAVEFLEKPFGDEHLLAALHSAFRLLANRPHSKVENVRHALNEGHIVAHYQPKVALRHRTITGFEALMRRSDDDFNDSEKNIREAFEDERLGRALSARMLDCIVDDITVWMKAGVEFGQVSFNVTSRDLEEETYAEALLNRLSDAGIPAAKLEVEALETVAFNPENPVVRNTLEKLSRGGISVALDDFGTGYASLTHLRSLPIDSIKIDRSFVAGLEDSSSQSIVRAIVGLAKGLNKQVVAEGVETAEQSHFLASIDCDTAQGFLFGKAVPAEKVPDLLQSKRLSH